jgi:putative endonuclease
LSTRDIGNIGEQAVCDFLIRHGYEIVKRNYTVRGGEIDIIARKGDTYALVEVKTRKQGALSSGEEAVTASKKKHLIYAAERFYSTLESDAVCRFDVAAVTVDGGRVVSLKYYVSAFDASK